jgi:hypothetical protein
MVNPSSSGSVSRSARHRLSDIHERSVVVDDGLDLERLSPEELSDLIVYAETADGAELLVQKMSPSQIVSLVRTVNTRMAQEYDEGAEKADNLTSRLKDLGRLIEEQRQEVAAVRADHDAAEAARHAEMDALRADAAEVRRQMVALAAQAADDREEEVRAEFRRQREGTAGSGGMAAKSDKLPDPPVFEQGTATEFRSWERKMRDKLEINDDRFETERKKIAYASSRIGGVAATVMEPYLDRDSASLVRTLDGFFEKLQMRFGDPFLKKTARDEFRRLRQANREFQVFLGDFHRLAAEAGIHEEDQLLEMQDKINTELKQACIGWEPSSLASLIQKLQLASRQHTEIRRAEAAKKARSALLASAGTSSSSNAASQNKAGAAGSRRANSNLICYGCGEKGHIRPKCPKNPKQVAEVNEAGNDSPPQESQ